MKKIGEGISDFIVAAAGSNDTGHKSRRIVEVNTRWRRAVDVVYKEAAFLILKHINAVYVMKPEEVKGDFGGIRVTDGGTVLVVYCEDSTVRSDLDARQELLKRKLNEQGEHVEAFRLLPARGSMRTRHPFNDEEYDEKNKQVGSAVTTRATHQNPLPPATVKKIEDYVKHVENTTLKEAIQKAITADFQSKMSLETKKHE